MGRSRQVVWVGLVVWLVAGCGGDDPPPADVTPAGDDDATPAEPVTASIPADWTAPACGVEADRDLDRTASYAGGQLRLCVRAGEVRLWALAADGRPDPAFAKGGAEVRFTPTGGDEQLISGLMLKGTAAEGYASRLLGHDGSGVTSATAVVGGETITF